MGQEDPQEEGVAPHSSIFAWIIPWTEKLASYIQSMELHTIAKRRLSTHVETTFYLSIQPSLDIWLLWIILVNRGIQIPVLVLAFNSLGDISRTGIARSDDNFSVFFFFFYELPYCFPQRLHQFIFGGRGEAAKYLKCILVLILRLHSQTSPSLPETHTRACLCFSSIAR